jgi:hypothetical protein
MSKEQVSIGAVIHRSSGVKAIGFLSWNQGRSLFGQAGSRFNRRRCFQAGVVGEMSNPIRFVGEMSKLLDIVGEMSKDWFHEFLTQASLAVITGSASNA